MENKTNISIEGYRTEGAETFYDVSDEKMELIYKILDFKGDDRCLVIRKVDPFNK